MGTQFHGQRSEDAIVISPENNSNWQEFKEPISRKRWNSEEPPSNPSKRPNCLLFKTRLCVKFRSGSCANGPNCNFAHGCEELRKPPAPANWQESVTKDGSVSVEQMLVANKICRKFYRGEVCSYGERCAFVHVEPGMLGENPNVSKGNAAGLEPGDENIVVIGTGSGKPMFWKTRMCNKWEAMGYCPFGDKCHFAHGHAELMEFKNYFELERANIAAAPLKPHLQHIKVVSPSTTAPNAKHQAKGFLKWKGRKVSHIYADWIDDNPLRAFSSLPKAEI